MHRFNCNTETMNIRNENGPALFGAVSGVERAIPLDLRQKCLAADVLDLKPDSTPLTTLTEGSALKRQFVRASHFPRKRVGSTVEARNA